MDKIQKIQNFTQFTLNPVNGNLNESFNHLNLLDRSEVRQQTINCHENFANIKCISSTDFVFFTETEESLSHLWSQDNNYSYFEGQKVIYDVLSLHRGSSQVYSEHYTKNNLQKTDLISSISTVNLNLDTINPQGVKFQTILYDQLNLSSLINSSEEFFINHNNQIQKDIIKKCEKNSSEKASTKNVTKNLGKLLLKFIWKNRQSLRLSLKFDEFKWQQFLQKIRLWKKENNITRQYLINLWHSQGEHSKLLRTISCYFFRRKCRLAIQKSNIEHKMVHINKIYKFQEAIMNPEALNSLN